MKRAVFSLVIALFASPTAAQWQIPAGSVPLGRGPGVVGFDQIAPGADNNCVTSAGGTWVAVPCVGGGGTVSPCAVNTLVTGAGAGLTPTCSDIANSAQYLAGTPNKFIQAGVIYEAETTTTFGTTTTFDFSTFINTAVTLTGNITTQNVSNVMIGKAGTITFIQDGTGSRTTVWNSVFKFSGGITPTLTATAGGIDVLQYTCRSASFCVAALVRDVR